MKDATWNAIPLILAILIAAGIVLATSLAFGAPISKAEAQCIAERLQLELDLNPAYIWGAAGLLPGAPGDCSGKIYAILASCGISVERLTAAMIAAGDDGWGFPKAAFDEIRPLALYFMTMTPNRPRGHMGIVIYILPSVAGEPPVIMLAHASTTAGFIAVPVKPESWARTRFDWARNLQ
jgi:hypothetical protein